ncbi:MAG: NDP-hexose 2,3-dehydratase family protein [Candidatus Omnitrophica bacterium]|nr:NDP-hexose 2,3-dehydratase family protein [Candidatus Omnitrophota bacterium]
MLRSIGRTEAEVKRDAALGLKVDFFLSSITPFSKFMTLEEIVAWLTRFRETSQNSVERIGIRDLEKWRVEEGTGNIRHESGKFFSIEGVRIQMKNREVASWCQPIINQPEVGILGIIVKKIDGLYYFLMQAKTEPGNIDGYLISPTVQATKSNYTKVHGGRFPPFVEFFLNRRKDGRRSIYEGLQSEEGARFWKKNNLNVILEVDEGEFDEIPPEFCWMTLYQLKQLLLRDNFVNVCARSVLSCLP